MWFLSKIKKYIITNFEVVAVETTEDIAISKFKIYNFKDIWNKPIEYFCNTETHGSTFYDVMELKIMSYFTADI